MEWQPTSTIGQAFLELCVLAQTLAVADSNDPRVAKLHEAASILQESYPGHCPAPPTS